MYRSVGGCEGVRGSTPSEPADPSRTPITDTVADTVADTDTDTDRGTDTDTDTDTDRATATDSDATETTSRLNTRRAAA